MDKSDTFELQAIGSHWKIKVFGLGSDTGKHFTEIAERMTTFESQFSRFKEASYVGQLNKNYSVTEFPQELYEMLTYEMKVSQLTDGAFSPFIGAKLNHLGYDAKYSFETQQSGEQAKPEFVELSPTSIKIPEHSSIDLGGIGKGWLIDKIADYLKSNNVESFIINGGGDIFATTQPDGSAFTCILEHPLDTTLAIGEIEVKNAAVACSAPNRRTWTDKKTGIKAHHLVSMKTGESIDDLAAVFTYAPTATEADTASTALFVSSPKTHEAIQKYLNVEYLLVSPELRILSSAGYPGRVYVD